MIAGEVDLLVLECFPDKPCPNTPDGHPRKTILVEPDLSRMLQDPINPPLTPQTLLFFKRLRGPRKLGQRSFFLAYQIQDELEGDINLDADNMAFRAVSQILPADCKCLAGFVKRLEADGRAQMVVISSFD